MADTKQAPAIDLKASALWILHSYFEGAMWRGMIFFAQACMDWMEKLAEGKKHEILEHRQALEKFEKSKPDYAEANNHLTKRHDAKDSKGNTRTHIGFDVPGQLPGTWFSGVDKTLYDIIVEQKDLQRLCKFGCRGSEVEYVASSAFYPN